MLLLLLLLLLSFVVALPETPSRSPLCTRARARALLFDSYAGAISGTLYVCLLPILVHLSALKSRQLLTNSAVVLHLFLILGGTALFANGLI